MIGPRTLVIALAIPAACAPPAQTVGGWSTGDASSSTAAPTTTGAETSEASTSSESSGAGTSSGGTESSSSSGTTGVAVVPPWIATIADDAPPRLQVVDLDDGDVIDVCALADVPVPDALAWLADGRLVASRAADSTLWLADPCDCTVTPVALEPAVAFHAMTELDDGSDLIIGADTGRTALIVVRLSVPEVVAAIDFVEVGSIAALTRSGDELLALAPAALWHVDASDGSVTQSVPVALAAVATGATISPIDDAMLVCDDDGALWRVDPDDGAVAPLGLVLPGACRTLATAPAPVACIEALLLE